MQAIAAVGSVFGIISSIKSLFSKPKSPAVQQMPKAPTEADAQAKASDEEKKRRRMMSQTDATHGQALVPQLNVQSKSLLGTSNAYA